MKNLCRAASVASVAVLLCGCIESKIELTVNRDGSGAFVFQNIQPPTVPIAGGKRQDRSAIKEMIKKQMLKDEYKEQLAKVFGKGVTCKSTEYVERKDGHFGTKSILEFKDINTVAIPADPELGTQVPLGFTFKKGDQSRLTVTIEKNERAQSLPITTAKEWDEQITSATPMLEGMTLDINVKVNGSITKTDAKYVDKKQSVVSIMKVDAGQMLSDRKNLIKALVADGMDLVDLAKHPIKGMQSQVPLKPVYVEFE